jgi:hypothetical protein
MALHAAAGDTIRDSVPHGTVVPGGAVQVAEAGKKTPAPFAFFPALKGPLARAVDTTEHVSTAIAITDHVTALVASMKVGRVAQPKTHEDGAQPVAQYVQQVRDGILAFHQQCSLRVVLDLGDMFPQDLRKDTETTKEQYQTEHEEEEQGTQMTRRAAVLQELFKTNNDSSRRYVLARAWGRMLLKPEVGPPVGAVMPVIQGTIDAAKGLRWVAPQDASSSTGHAGSSGDVGDKARVRAPSADSLADIQAGVAAPKTEASKKKKKSKAKPVE